MSEVTDQVIYRLLIMSVKNQTNSKEIASDLQIIMIKGIIFK